MTQLPDQTPCYNCTQAKWKHGTIKLREQHGSCKRFASLHKENAKNHIRNLRRLRRERHQ